MDAEMLIAEAQEILNNIPAIDADDQPGAYRHTQTLALLAIAHSLNNIDYKLIELLSDRGRRGEKR
jgi:hypothetical protein